MVPAWVLYSSAFNFLWHALKPKMLSTEEDRSRVNEGWTTNP